jgi:hypothetical protein
VLYSPETFSIIRLTNQNLIQEQIERELRGLWQWLLPFGPEPSVFSVAVEKLTN